MCDVSLSLCLSLFCHFPIRSLVSSGAWYYRFLILIFAFPVCTLRHDNAITSNGPRREQTCLQGFANNTGAVLTTCDFVAIEEKLAMKFIFFLECWFRHVLWWLLGIVSLRRFLWVPSSCDCFRQIIRVSTDNWYFLLHWFRYELLDRHRERNGDII